MTNKVSLDKSKIKFVLLEGVQPKCIRYLTCRRLHQYRLLQKALDGDELKEAIKDAHFIGLRSRTNLTKEMIEAAPKLVPLAVFVSEPTKWILMRQNAWDSGI